MREEKEGKEAGKRMDAGNLSVFTYRTCTRCSPSRVTSDLLFLPAGRRLPETTIYRPRRPGGRHDARARTECSSRPRLALSRVEGTTVRLEDVISWQGPKSRGDSVFPVSTRVVPRCRCNNPRRSYRHTYTPTSCRAARVPARPGIIH